MRRLLLLRVAVVAAAVAYALTSASATTIDELDWLTGCWQSTSEGRQTTEHWMKPAGRTMLGVSRTISGDRTVEFEFMRIQQEEGGAVYLMAIPSGQREARFKLTKASPREVVFENPTHDFPQKISYRLDSKDSLLGRISGTSKGKDRSIDFPMKRVPCDDGDVASKR